MGFDFRGFQMEFIVRKIEPEKRSEDDEQPETRDEKPALRLVKDEDDAG